MSLLDLRSYWTRKAEPCRVEERKPGMHPAQLGWFCTLPAGHDGSHVAHDIDGTLITRWRNQSPERSVPCDCDYWHNKHRFHCATRYPPGRSDR